MSAGVGKKRPRTKNPDAISWLGASTSEEPPIKRRRAPRRSSTGQNLTAAAAVVSSSSKPPSMFNEEEMVFQGMSRSNSDDEMDIAKLYTSVVRMDYEPETPLGNAADIQDEVQMGTLEVTPEFCFVLFFLFFCCFEIRGAFA
jgi:hypothetical protein